MTINSKLLKEIFYNKTFFMGTVIVALGFTTISGIDANQKLTERLFYQQEQTREFSIMYFNTKLEKIDFAESEKEKISQAPENEKAELAEKSSNIIKNKFREVHYIRNNEHPSKIIEVDFSDLDISCDTYNKFLPTQLNALSGAKLVNKNCDGNK